MRRNQKRNLRGLLTFFVGDFCGWNGLSLRVFMVRHKPLQHKLVLCVKLGGA